MGLGFQLVTDVRDPLAGLSTRQPNDGMPSRQVTDQPASDLPGHQAMPSRQLGARPPRPAGRHRRPVPVSLPQSAPALVLAVPGSDTDLSAGPVGELAAILRLMAKRQNYVLPDDVEATLDPWIKVGMRSRSWGSAREMRTLLERARVACRDRSHNATTVGYGPRLLHSTGQLHKGGPNTGLFLQVVDDGGEELPIPGKPFGFRRFIRSQAEGDYESLKARGRRVARVVWED